MGNLKLRKLIKEETIWKDKNKDEHKCKFVIPCILKVSTKQNIIKYYNVKKCNQCLSFKSISKWHNVNGCIFGELNEEQKRLPVIRAFLDNYYTIGFQNLKNVTYEGDEENENKKSRNERC